MIERARTHRFGFQSTPGIRARQKTFSSETNYYDFAHVCDRFTCDGGGGVSAPAPAPCAMIKWTRARSPIDAFARYTRARRHHRICGMTAWAWRRFYRFMRLCESVDMVEFFFM